MSEEEFKKAVAHVNDPSKASGDTSNDTKLKFYALFKQAT
jgi:acyl-CoA-binding protein